MNVPENLKKILQEDTSNSVVLIHGGTPLKGSVTLQGAKNIALQAIAAAILTDEDVTLDNLPAIGDIKTNLKILETLGASVTWNSETSATINCANLNNSDIDPREAEKTTGSKYFIPLLVQRFQKVTTGGPGGDRIGGDDRYQITERIRAVYNAMGIECLPQTNEADESFVEFRKKEKVPDSLSLEEPYFGPTIQSLLFNVLSPTVRTFTLNNPCIEPEIITTIDLLKSMGADITIDLPNKRYTIISKPKLSSSRFRIPSDPNALVSYAVMTLITDGDVIIENIDHTDKIDAFLSILSKINAAYSYSKNKQNLKISSSLKKLKSTNLETRIWPAECHTDWQQILTPLLAITDGDAYIDENFYPERFKTKPLQEIFGNIFELINNPERLVRERFKTDGKPHTLLIHGSSSIAPKASDVTAPDDIRGATGVFAALLAAKGWSVLRNFNQVLRGLANPVEILNNLGATVIDRNNMPRYIS